MKKVIILGASFLQIPIIKTAKSLGYYTVVADMNPEAEGFKYADKKYVVSTIDTKALIEVVEKEKPDGIVTAATDMPMRSIGYIGEKFNFNTVSYETALKATDKYKMREALFNFGVPVPKYFLVDSENEYFKAISKIKGKKIVKPIDSSGSRGIFLLEDDNEAKTAYQHALDNSKSKTILVEEYMQGEEVSVETLTVNGETHVIAITDKITTGAPHFIEHAHKIQSNKSEIIKSDIEKVAIAANKALSIESGPSHTEIMVTSEGPKIVEIGVRLGGDFITSHLVKYATGIDIIEAYLKQSVGEPLANLKDHLNKGCAVHFIQSKPGVLKTANIPEHILNHPQVIEVGLTAKVGDVLGEANSSTSRIGHIICQADDSDKALELCEELIKEIEIVIV